MFYDLPMKDKYLVSKFFFIFYILQIEDVLKVSDPAEDWRVDPILHDACLPVVQSRCKGFKGGEGRCVQYLKFHVLFSNSIDMRILLILKQILNYNFLFIPLLPFE